MRTFMVFASCLAVTSVAGQRSFVRPSLRGNNPAGGGNSGQFGNSGLTASDLLDFIGAGAGGNSFEQSSNGGFGGQFGSGIGNNAGLNGGSGFGSQPGSNSGRGVGNGGGAGGQQGGRVLRFVSVHVAPEDTTPREPRVIHAGGGGAPDTHVNFIFVKAPSGDSDQQTEVVLPEPPKQRTLVYVLLKKPAAGEDSIKLRAPAPTKPSKPQVFFIQYKPDGGASGDGESGSANRAGSNGSGLGNGFSASGGLGSGFEGSGGFPSGGSNGFAGNSLG